MTNIYDLFKVFEFCGQIYWFAKIEGKRDIQKICVAVIVVRERVGAAAVLAILRI